MSPAKKKDKHKAPVATPTRVGKTVFGDNPRAETPVPKPHKIPTVPTQVAVETPKEPQQHVEDKAPVNSRGRPQEHTESWTKATVVLLDRHIYWLDRLTSDIRFKTKAAMSRAEIIRAMISAVEGSGIDLSQLSSEEAIKDLLLNKLTSAK